MSVHIDISPPSTNFFSAAGTCVVGGPVQRAQWAGEPRASEDVRRRRGREEDGKGGIGVEWESVLDCVSRLHV